MTVLDLLMELKGLAETKRIEFLRRLFDGRTDPWRVALFGLYFFKDIIRGEWVPDFHLELIAFYFADSHGVAMEPRGFAKTTWCKICAVYEIVTAKRGAEPFILWVGPTKDDAKASLIGIKDELENNDLLRAVYGDMVGRDKWSDGLMVTSNRCIVMARGRAKGRGVNYLNRRPTRALLDDIEDDQSVKNPALREETFRWITRVVIPALGRRSGRHGGVMKMIGTYIHEAAVVGIMHKRYGGPLRRAIEDGKALWPENFPIEVLNRIRDGYLDGESGEWKDGIGTFAFASEYMNDPKDKASMTLDPDKLTAAMCRPPTGTVLEVAIHLDPKAGQSKMSDEWVVTTVGRPLRSNHRYVIEQVAGSDPSPNEQLKQLITAYRRMRADPLMRVQHVTVEVVLNQTAIYQNFLDWKARRLNLSVPGSPFDEDDRNVPIGQWSPAGRDKLERRNLLDPDFLAGFIHLTPEMDACRDQLCMLGLTSLEHDDRADSLIAACLLLGKRPEQKAEEANRTGGTEDRGVTAGLLGRTY